MEIYEFLFTDCIYESAYATMSMHRTKKGAYQAMRKFILDGYYSWYNERIIYGKFKSERITQDKFGTHQRWTIRSTQLLE